MKVVHTSHGPVALVAGVVVSAPASLPVPAWMTTLVGCTECELHFVLESSR